MLKASNKALEEELKKKGIKAQSKDIIVNKIKIEETIKEDGTIEIKRKKTPVNLTKKINETAKLFKQDQIQQKLDELKEIFEKKE